MHETQITVLSMRKDGKAIKALLPGEGEQWLSLPDGLIGKLEWKGSYHIGWTKTPRQDGGSFYNLKKLGNGAATVTPIRPHVPTSTAHPDKDKQIAVLAIFKTVWPSYIALQDAAVDAMGIAKVLRECMKGYDMSLGGQNVLPADRPYDDRVDDIGDTF